MFDYQEDLKCFHNVPQMLPQVIYQIEKYDETWIYFWEYHPEFKIAKPRKELRTSGFGKLIEKDSLGGYLPYYQFPYSTIFPNIV